MKRAQGAEGNPHPATSFGAGPARARPKWAKPNHKCSTCKGRRFEDNEELYLDRTTGQWTRSCSVCLAKRRKPRQEPPPQAPSWLAPAAIQSAGRAPAPPGYWFSAQGWDMSYTAPPPEGYPPFAMSGGFPLHPAYVSPTAAYVEHMRALQASVATASPALAPQRLPRRSGPPQSPHRPGGRVSETFSAPAAPSIIGMPSRHEMRKPSPGPVFSYTPPSDQAMNPFDPAHGLSPSPAWRNSVSYPAAANAAGWMVGAGQSRANPQQEPPHPTSHAAWMKHSMTQPLVPPQFGWGGRFQPSEGYAFPYRYGAGRMPPPETVCQASVGSSEERGSTEGESRLIPLATLAAAATAASAPTSTSAVAGPPPRPPTWMEGSTRQRSWQPPPPVDTGRARPQGRAGASGRGPASSSSGHTTSSDSQRTAASGRRWGAGMASPGFLLAHSVHPLGSPPAALGLTQGQAAATYVVPSRAVGAGHAAPSSRKRSRDSREPALPASAPVASRRKLRSSRGGEPAWQSGAASDGKWREQLPPQATEAAAAPAAAPAAAAAAAAAVEAEAEAEAAAVPAPAPGEAAADENKRTSEP